MSSRTWYRHQKYRDQDEAASSTTQHNAITGAHTSAVATDETSTGDLASTGPLQAVDAFGEGGMANYASPQVNTNKIGL